MRHRDTPEGGSCGRWRFGRHPTPDAARGAPREPQKEPACRPLSPQPREDRWGCFPPPPGGLPQQLREARGLVPHLPSRVLARGVARGCRRLPPLHCVWGGGRGRGGEPGCQQAAARDPAPMGGCGDPEADPKCRVAWGPVRGAPPTLRPEPLPRGSAGGVPLALDPLASATWVAWSCPQVAFHGRFLSVMRAALLGPGNHTWGPRVLRVSASASAPGGSALCVLSGAPGLSPS